MAKFKKLALLCSAILMTTSLAVGIAACEEEHVHTYGTAWEKDATNHWYGCTDETCTLEIGKEAHKWNDGVVTTNPTETAEGVKTYTCVVCSQTKTEAVAALGHVHAWATTWEKDATNHWHACTNGTTCTEKSDVAAHDWNAGVVTTAATEDAEGVMTYTCEVEGCGATKTEAITKLAHVHVYDNTWETSAEKHWYGCTKAGCTTGKIGEANHTWDEGVEQLAPTEEAFGEMDYTCKVCGYVKTEAIPKLTPDPLRVAKGTVTAKDGGTNVDVTVTIPATDSYIIKTDKVSSRIFAGSNSSYFGGELQFDAEAGEMTISFGYGENYNQADVEIAYEIKKVPAVTVTSPALSGEIEMSTNVWVRVAFNVPVAGRYMLTADGVVFEANEEDPTYSWLSGEQSYVYTTTADNQIVTVLAKAESADATATVAYEVTPLVAQELIEGNNMVEMVGNGTVTEVSFTLPAAGTYHFSAYDDTLQVYTDTDYTLASKANGSFYFEGEADEEVTFFLYSIADDVTFNISEFTDEERYTTAITATFAEGSYETTVTANIKKGTSASIEMVGGYVVEWDNEDVTFSYYGVEATTQSVYYGYGPMEMRSMAAYPVFTNDTENDVEFTITLKAISQDNPLDGSVEIIFASGAEIPVQLDAKAYEMSISNDATTLTVVYGFDYNDTTVGTLLTTTAQNVTATGEVEILYIQNNNVDTTTLMPIAGSTMFTVSNPLALGANTLALGETKTFTPADSAMYAIVNIQAQMAGLTYKHPTNGMDMTIDSQSPFAFQGALTLTAQGNPNMASGVSFEIVKLTALTTGDNAVDVTINNGWAVSTWCAFTGTGSYTIALADGEETANITLWVINPMLNVLVPVDLAEYESGFTFEATGDPIVVLVSSTNYMATSDTINFTITEVTA